MMKVAWTVLKKIYGLLCMLFTPLKRLWCRRKRRNSDTILPMTMAAHYPSVENLSNGTTQEELSPWDAWDDQGNKIRTVEQFRYYQQQALQRQTSEKEEEPDYFQDLTPSVTKQKKLLIRKKEEDINTSAISSKLAVSSDIPLSQSPDLGAWEEEKVNAWDNEGTEDLSWEAENVIKEKRRAERQQRQLEQQKKKLERDQQRLSKSHAQGHLTAMKLS